LGEFVNSVVIDRVAWFIHRRPPGSITERNTRIHGMRPDRRHGFAGNSCCRPVDFAGGDLSSPTAGFGIR
jgi:hypothetical protein